jgi:hypothetical protein
MATTASFPDFDWIDSLILPAWKYQTCSATSPCLNVAAPRRYRTIALATPADSTNA